MSAVGKTVVVTGAARGIGRALAMRFSAEGCRVIVSDLGTDETGHELASLAREIKAHAVLTDISTPDGVAALYESARSQFGTIDAWYGNAGVDRGRGLITDEQDWFNSYEVNVMAHVRAARLLLPDWLERGCGRFVVTASAAGLLTMLTAPAYSVSKHAAVAFAEWLSATYQHRGIVAQVICPQGVRTSMYGDLGHVQDLVGRDRVLDASEVADAAWDAAQDNRFLILPHPRVAEYYIGRATDTDRWLRGMNYLQQDLEQTAKTPTQTSSFAGTPEGTE